jgi:hypothetical protein
MIVNIFKRIALEIKIATEEEIKHCYKVMHQSRSDLSEIDFINSISAQIKNGYKVVYVLDNREIICLAGFIISKKHAWGKHLYIDDFVTNKSVKSSDAAKALLDFMKIYAKQQNCNSIHLDSSVERAEAHKFYLKENLKIDTYHFSIDLN